MEPKKLGVLGCGQMGAGIVQVFAQAGYEVIACDTVPADDRQRLKRHRQDDSQAAWKKAS